jgi:hypothetical protein
MTCATPKSAGHALTCCPYRHGGLLNRRKARSYSPPTSIVRPIREPSLTHRSELSKYAAVNATAKPIGRAQTKNLKITRIDSTKLVPKYPLAWASFRSHMPGPGMTISEIPASELGWWSSEEPRQNLKILLSVASTPSSGAGDRLYPLSVKCKCWTTTQS